ncbi:uncharacterized protein [Apostichopus japonicus]|uniref:uncharacterized protein n=1 Tax=Stichopus japonicus TaxID=307972 RepID=UPI003AB6848D
MNASSDLNGRSLPITLDGPFGVLDQQLTDTPSAGLRHHLTTGPEQIEERPQQRFPRNTEASKHHVSKWNKVTNGTEDQVQQLPVPAQISLNAINDRHIDNDNDDESDDESDTDSVIDTSECDDVTGVNANTIGDMIKVTAKCHWLLRKYQRMNLDEKRQEDESPVTTLEPDVNNLKTRMQVMTLLASPLPMDDNTDEESCCNDSTLASLAEEGRLPWMQTSADMEEDVFPCWSEEAHPDIGDLVRATVEVECEVKSKEPYNRRDRFVFQWFLDDRRMSRIWVEEKLHQDRIHQREFFNEFCPFWPPITAQEYHYDFFYNFNGRMPLEFQPNYSQVYPDFDPWMPPPVSQFDSYHHGGILPPPPPMPWAEEHDRSLSYQYNLAAYYPPCRPHALDRCALEPDLFPTPLPTIPPKAPPSSPPMRPPSSPPMLPPSSHAIMSRDIHPGEIIYSKVSDVLPPGALHPSTHQLSNSPPGTDDKNVILTPPASIISRNKTEENKIIKPKKTFHGDETKKVTAIVEKPKVLVDRVPDKPKPTLNIHKEENISNQMLINPIKNVKVQKRVRFDLSKNQTKTVSRYLIGRRSRVIQPVSEKDNSPAKGQIIANVAATNELTGLTLSASPVSTHAPSTSNHVTTSLSSQKRKFLAKCKKQPANASVTDGIVEGKTAVRNSGLVVEHCVMHDNQDNDVQKCYESSNYDNGKTEYGTDRKVAGEGHNKTLVREERKGDKFVETSALKEKNNRRLRWTDSLTSFPVNKKSKKFKLKERTQQQTCQSIDETGQKSSISCQSSFHGTGELIDEVPNNGDQHCADDLAVYWNQKPHRRNRSVDLSTHAQRGIERASRDAPSQSSQVSSATNRNDDLGMEPRLAIFGLIICSIFTFALSLIIYDLS